MCGNYYISVVVIANNVGSPPRVRELHGKFGSQTTKAGITPACAGITQHQHPCAADAQDHPRVCGNYGIEEVKK